MKKIAIIPIVALALMVSSANLFPVNKHSKKQHKKIKKQHKKLHKRHRKIKKQRKKIKKQHKKIQKLKTSTLDEKYFANVIKFTDTAYASNGAGDSNNMGANLTYAFGELINATMKNADSDTKTKLINLRDKVETMYHTYMDRIGYSEYYLPFK